MSLSLVEKDEILFHQNSIGKYLYIVKEGVLKLCINSKETTTFQKGDSFGELALLHEAPRSGTVTAMSQSMLWVLERKNFKKIVQHVTKLSYEENRSFLDSNPLLSQISNDEKTILSSSMIKEVYDSGKLIFREGDFASSIYLIKNGEVNCISNGKVVRTLKEGEFFGERAILLDSLRTLDVVAKTSCVCFSVSLENLKKLLGEDYRKILYFKFIKYAFSKSVFLKGFNNNNDTNLEKIFDLFTIKNFEKNKIVFTKNSECKKINVIIEGSLVKVKNKK
jgi:CRP-like cAMP-binding protein